MRKIPLHRYKDLVASTYSGKVLGFTADPAAQDATGAQMVDLCPEGGANPVGKLILSQSSEILEIFIGECSCVSIYFCSSTNNNTPPPTMMNSLL